MDYKEIIKSLNLIPHPEGGYYCETYRSKSVIPQMVLPNFYSGDRNFGTLIYYMLVENDISCFHRLYSDEIWHFYEGTAVIIYIINDKRILNKIRLGNNIENNDVFHCVIEAGSWFAAELEDKSSYALMGCTVVPGFHFDDFEIGKRVVLLKQFPEHRELVTKMTNK